MSDRLIQRASEAQERLTANDLLVVNYFRQHTDVAMFASVDELASRIGVSTASVVRAAQKLGYSGLADMRRDLQEEWFARQSSPLTRFQDGMPTTLELRLKHVADGLESTQQIASQERMNQAAKLLSQAQTISSVGHMKSHALAVYSWLLLRSVRPGVRLIDPSFPEYLDVLTKRDVLLAFTFSRYSTQTLTTIDAYLEAGARVILVTDALGQMIARPGVIALLTETHSGDFYQSHVMPTAVIEAIASEVAALDPERAKRTLKRTEDLAGPDAFFLH